MHTDAPSPFIRKPGRSCLKACMSIPPPAWLPTTPAFYTGAFQICSAYLKTGCAFKTQKLCKCHFLCLECLLLSPNPLIISLRNFLFPFPKSQPSLLQEPSPHNFILGVTSLLYHKQVSTITLTLHGNLLVTCLPPTTRL